MSKELIDTKQIEQHFAAANEAAEKSSKMARGAVIEAIEAGEQLNRAKESVPHGEWAAYLGKHWNYSQRLATQYMLISNWQSSANLIEAKSINEALRMIADDKEEKTAPRSKRKPADVVVSIPTDPPADDPDDVGDVSDYPPGDFDITPDPDPALDPPTQRKTAKGSEKVPEADKPRTQHIPVEIVDDEPKEIFPEEKTLSDFTFKEILEFIADSVAGDEKTVAKQLRKLADKLDPPTKFVKPDLDDVSAYFAELKAVDADSFFDFYESKGWLVGKVSMKDWRASARKWVRENASNGKANGNGHRTTATRNGGNRGLTAEDVFSAESLGRGSKRN